MGAGHTLTKLAQQAFLQALEERADKLGSKLGLIERAWNAIGVTAGKFSSGLANIGRELEPAEKLANLLEARAARKASPSLGRNINKAAEDAELARLIRLTQARGVEAAAAASEAAATDKEIDGRKAAAAAMREQESAAKALAKALFAADVGNIQRGSSAAASAFERAQQELEGQRRAGLVTDNAYFAAKETLIKRDTEIQIAALEAENARISAQKASGPERIANLQKEGDNIAKIGLLSEQAAAQVRELRIEQTAAGNAAKLSYQTAQAAAAEYLEVLKRRQDLELAGLGAGSRARDFNRGRADTEDRFIQQKRDLENAKSASLLQGKFGPAEQNAYKEQLQLIKDSQKEALKSYDDFYAELTEKQGSFFVGASEAFQNYIDESQNTAAQVASALSKGFDAATDALVQFVQTGKLDFKGLVDSILADLLRIKLQKELTSLLTSAIKLIVGAFGGGAGLSGSSGVGELTGSTVGFAAGGGDISGPTIVGERGPELIIPRAPMTVIPNHALGGPQINIKQEFNIGAGADVAQFQAAGKRLKEETKAEIYQDLARNRVRV